MIPPQSFLKRHRSKSIKHLANEGLSIDSSKQDAKNHKTYNIKIDISDAFRCALSDLPITHQHTILNSLKVLMRRFDLNDINDNFTSTMDAGRYTYTIRFIKSEDGLIANTIEYCLNKRHVDWIRNHPDGDTLSTVPDQNAPKIPFNQQSPQKFSVPTDGKAKPYPGKRLAGDIRNYLAENYPHRPDGEPLTLNWLEQHDRSAYRAMYSQSDDETGTPAEFFARGQAGSAALLRRHLIDLETPDGLAEARQLYGLLSSRLYPRKSR